MRLRACAFEAYYQDRMEPQKKIGQMPKINKIKKVNLGSEG